MKKLCVLGITGSIGRNVADVVKQNPGDFIITGVAFNSSADIFASIYHDHPSIKHVYAGDEKIIPELKKNYPSLTFYHGEDGLCRLISASGCDMAVNALVGFAGLVPTVYALRNNIDVALANKESLVVGGELINNILSQNDKVHLYPIDSEHVALAKCLKHKKPEEIDSLIITASGGSFRDLKRSELADVTVTQALNHPSWRMGAKITIDSATMVNKGFEIIEAHYLFGMPLEKIHVLLHDESVIHSAVQLVDHSIVADLGPADMRVPISYALYEGNYHEINNISYLKLEDLGALHFRKYDPERYPGVELAKKALATGGTMPCVLNAANEAVNLSFRQGKIAFTEIEEIIGKVMSSHQVINNPDLEDMIRINRWAYEEAMKYVERRK